MRDLAIDAVTNYPAVRAQALALMRDLYATGPADLTRAVEAFVRQHVTLVDEYEELIQHPVVMLQMIRLRGAATGDCDDAAVLAAALLLSVGIKVRFKAVWPDPGTGGFQHVFLEYQRGDKWIALDTTISHAPVYPGEVLTVEV
jgi:transglutaminase-like putative cysteine protease